MTSHQLRSFICSLDNGKWNFCTRTFYLFSHSNKVYIIVVLSVLNQKIYPDPRKAIFNAVFIFPIFSHSFISGRPNTLEHRNSAFQSWNSVAFPFNLKLHFALVCLFFCFVFSLKFESVWAENWQFHWTPSWRG